MKEAWLARPEKLLERVAAQSHKKTIVIDEVQKVPALLNRVHLLIEKKVFPHDLKALQAFLEDYPEAKALLLYRGKEKL